MKSVIGSKLTAAGMAPARSHAAGNRRPGLSLLPLVLLLGCDGQLQSASSTPFSRAEPAAAPAAVQAPPLARSAAPARPAPAASSSATSAGVDPRSLTPPLLAPIPLRGRLEEDLVYEGVLDAPSTQAVVRALEAASQQAAEQATPAIQ